MNYSPLNDPEFQAYRESVRKASAKKRRTKALIVLTAVALLGALLFGLLAMAAVDAAKSAKDGLIPDLVAKLEAMLKDLTGNSATTDLPALPSSPQEGQSSLPPPPPSQNGQSPSNEAPASPSEPSPSPSDPKPLRVTTVYLDPGHGFTNSYGAPDLGAGEGSEYYRLSLEQTGTGLFEADLNLAVAMKVKALLEAEGYKVITSREGYVNSHLSINDRAINAKNSGADLLVSVHGNSAAPAAYGARVFYCNRRNDSFEYAKAVAEAIDKNGASRKKATTNLDNTLAMVNSVGMPAVLVETCFMTNTEDSRMALTEAWQDAMAKSIVEGIVKVFPCQTYFE